MKHTLKKIILLFYLSRVWKEQNFWLWYQILPNIGIDLKDPTSIGLNLIGAHT